MMGEGPTARRAKPTSAAMRAFCLIIALIALVPQARAQPLPPDQACSEIVKTLTHHRAPGLQPGGGASRLHRLPAIPGAQLAAAGFRQCDGRDRAEPARHHSLRSGAGGRRVVPDAHGRAVVQEAGEGEMNEWRNEPARGAAMTSGPQLTNSLLR